MFSAFIKYILVATSMAPVLLTLYGVTALKKGDWLAGYPFLISAIVLVILCLILLRKAKKNLEVIDVNITSVKNADHNIIGFLFVYLLPVLDIIKKDEAYVFGFILIVFFVIIINSNTYHFNPLLSLFGYKFYDITNDGNISYILITKKQILNTKDINQIVQITPYMVLDSNN